MKNKIKKIKTCILILVFGIFTNNLCHAQAALLVLIFGDKVATENFHLSIDGGWNLSTMPGLNQGKFNDGLYYGLGAFVKLNDRWAFTPEFKPLSPRGAKSVTGILSNDITLQNPETDYKINYMDVPLLVRFNISNSVYIAAGPQISFLGKAKQITTGSTSSGESVDIAQDIKPLMHKQNFMVPVELAYSLSKQRGGKGIDVKLRYNIGISDAFNTSLASSTNSTFQFFLSFPFINPPKEIK